MLSGDITKLLPERSKIKTDLLYFKYAPILVMLFRWYSVSQFYDNKMEITLWYHFSKKMCEWAVSLMYKYDSSYKRDVSVSFWDKEKVDRGLTYSSLSERRSVLAIGKCESDGSIINTIGHELLHVVAHICEQDGIDMLSEEPCYMMGSLCEKFFKVYD